MASISCLSPAGETGLASNYFSIELDALTGKVIDI
jgi:hypothetical protein